MNCKLLIIKLLKTDEFYFQFYFLFYFHKQIHDIIRWKFRSQTDWDRHTNVAGLFRLTVYQPSFAVNVHQHACCTFTFIFEYINGVK
jgi:hypothetical protein